jgi:hypothetical protein
MPNLIGSLQSYWLADASFFTLLPFACVAPLRGRPTERRGEFRGGAGRPLTKAKRSTARAGAAST